MSLDVLIHCALALLFALIAAAIGFGVAALGLSPVPLLAACCGSAVFMSRELAQAPYKAAARGERNRLPHIHHAEWLWPALLCLALAMAATVALRLL